LAESTEIWQIWWVVAQDFRPKFGQIDRNLANFVGGRSGFSAEIGQIWWVDGQDFWAKFGQNGDFRAKRPNLANFGVPAGISGKTEGDSPISVVSADSGNFGRKWGIWWVGGVLYDFLVQIGQIGGFWRLLAARPANTEAVGPAARRPGGSGRS
jgi:hypothetical protein